MNSRTTAARANLDAAMGAILKASRGREEQRAVAVRHLQAAGAEQAVQAVKLGNFREAHARAQQAQVALEKAAQPRHPATGQFVPQPSASDWGGVTAPADALPGQTSPGTLPATGVSGTTGVQNTEESKDYAPGSLMSAAMARGVARRNAAQVPIYARGPFSALMAAQAAYHQVRVWEAASDDSGSSQTFVTPTVTAPADLNPYVYAEFARKLAVMTNMFIERTGRPPIIDGDALDSDDVAFKQAVDTLTAQTWGDASGAPREVQGGATARFQPTPGGR